MTVPATAHAPFWSDDFDMDLLKVIPNAEAILDESAAIELVTHCNNPTHGRLNHPVVWNTHAGCAAFFGFDGPANPSGYEPGRAQLVRCTFLEVVRDCWSHDYHVIVEGRGVLDGTKFWEDFQPLMFDLRKWNSTMTDEDRDRRIGNVQRRLALAAGAVTRLHKGRSPFIQLPHASEDDGNV